jgi:phage baseplate assembly protein W
MSKGFKLTKVCDHKISWDDHIVENDFKTVILNVPIKDVNTVVRVNDFKRSRDFQNEFFTREDVSNQVTGLENTFVVIKGPIYNGLKNNQFATRNEDVIVRIRVGDCDNSGNYTDNVNSEVIQKNGTGQFTGIEDFFYTQAKPLLTSNKYDFSEFVTINDIAVFINSVLLTSSDIKDLDSKSGRVQLKNIPLITDDIRISYCYKAKVKEIDAQQSKVVLKQIPLLGQEVRIGYYSRQNDGWYLTNSSRSLVQNAKDIIFYTDRNTDRFFIEKENVSNQFTGVEQTFVTTYKPILPLYQAFRNTYLDTLNNAVIVYLNGEKVPIASINSEAGIIRLFQKPQSGDLVQVTYYYQTELEPDRISLDYYVDSVYCDKCSKFSDLVDYVINALGQYDYVQNENKLIQDIKKITITILGSDPVAPWYGTDFEKIIGKKQIPEILKVKIASEITTALSKLKAAQIQQENYQTVTDGEFLDTVKSINVQQSDAYQGLYTVDVDVSTQAGRLVAVQQTISNTKGI